MIRVDRSSVTPPLILRGNQVAEALEKARAHFASDDPASRQHRFEFDPPLFVTEEVRSALSRLFSGKCAFCESEVDGAAASPIVHHFRPTQEAIGADGSVSRPHYWWLAYEWDNLYLSCQRCATAAKEKFPVGRDRAPVGTAGPGLLRERPQLLDPCLDDPAEHLAFQADGTVEARTPRGEQTIDAYELNRRALVDVRRQAIERARSARLAARWRDPSIPYLGAIRQTLELRAEASPLGAFSRVFRFYREALLRIFRIFFPSRAAAVPVRAARIEELQVRNFRCVKELELTLAGPDDEQSWTVLLGENGHGKTSVLQALALLLAGEDERARIVADPESLIHDEADFAEVAAFVRGSPAPRTLRIERGRGFRANQDDDAVAIAAYGAARIPSSRQRSSPPPSRKRPRIDSLFDPGVPLVPAERWLSELEPDQFDYAARALRQLLPVPEDAVLTVDDGAVALSAGGRSTPLSQLSDGYRSMIALAVDVMSYFMTRYGSMDAAEGLVLVDELSAHLHPRWQMRVVEAFRDAFPTLQFVVTTHDPLCLRGLSRKEDVAVLQRTGEGAVYALADEEVPPLHGLRVDELLTSEVFGLNSTIDPGLEADFNLYYELLASRASGPENEARIEALKARLDQHRQLGSTPRERLALEAADEFLAQRRETPGSARRGELLTETREKLRAIWAGEER